eukprot:2305308-Lingulodinium_polyedra.AAC.1
MLQEGLTDLERVVRLDALCEGAELSESVAKDLLGVFADSFDKVAMPAWGRVFASLASPNLAEVADECAASARQLLGMKGIFAKLPEESTRVIRTKLDAMQILAEDMPLLAEALKKAELSPEDGKLVQRMVPVCAALPAELHLVVDGKDIVGEFVNGVTSPDLNAKVFRAHALVLEQSLNELLGLVPTDFFRLDKVGEGSLPILREGNAAHFSFGMKEAFIMAFHNAYDKAKAAEDHKTVQQLAFIQAVAYAANAAGVVLGLMRADGLKITEVAQEALSTMRVHRKAVRSLKESSGKGLASAFAFESNLKMHATVLDTQVPSPAEFLHALLGELDDLERCIANKWAAELARLEELVCKNGIPGWELAKKEICEPAHAELREKMWNNAEFGTLSATVVALDMQLQCVKKLHSDGCAHIIDPVLLKRARQTASSGAETIAVSFALYQ